MILVPVLGSVPFSMIALKSDVAVLTYCMSEEP